jgi:dihydrofolate reductase
MSFWDDALSQAIGETIAGEFDMLLGRRTYEIFAAYWPNQGDNPIAKAFNKATKLHIWGSSELLQTLIAAELVDEYRIWVFPLVLGEGKRLFENGVPPASLALVETRSTPKGVLINAYRRAGSLPPETSEPDNPSGAELARRKKLAAEGS